MNPQNKQSNRRFRIEKLEPRIAPAHVRLPAAPPMVSGTSDATEANPHFSGRLRPLPFVSQDSDP